MPEGRGGYRPPREPAQTSGPGSLSRRTDGQQPVRDLPNPSYGEGQQFRDLQRSAPLPDAGAQVQAPVDRSAVVPFSEGSQRPTEAILTGADRSPSPFDREDELMRLKTYIRPLKFIASLPGASPSTRQLVRQLMAAQ